MYRGYFVVNKMDPSGKTTVANPIAFLCSRAVAGVAQSDLRSGTTLERDLGGNRRGNAFQHCYVACRVLIACGLNGAVSWDGRETPGTPGGDMDLANNRQGYEIGIGNGTSAEDCWNGCKEKWESGELDCLGKPCPPPRPCDFGPNPLGYPRLIRDNTTNGTFGSGS